VEDILSNNQIVNIAKCRRPLKHFNNLNFTTTLYVSNFTLPDPDDDFSRSMFSVKRVISPKVLNFVHARSQRLISEV
jgi:hypothetical protein